MEPNENFWEAILSRDKINIVRAFNLLGKSEQIQVLEHLNRMSQEKGWHPEQVKSAKIAIKVLQL